MKMMKRLLVLFALVIFMVLLVRCGHSNKELVVDAPKDDDGLLWETIDVTDDAKVADEPVKDEKAAAADDQFDAMLEMLNDPLPSRPDTTLTKKDTSGVDWMHLIDDPISPPPAVIDSKVETAPLPINVIAEKKWIYE